MIKKLSVACFILFYSTHSFSQNPPFMPTDLHEAILQEENAANIYNAYFPDKKTAKKAVISLHGQLLETHYEKGYLVLELNEEEKERLAPFGFTFRPAEEFMQKRKQALKSIKDNWSSQHSLSLGKNTTNRNATLTNAGNRADFIGIPGYACYETVEETFTSMNNLVNQYPSLTRIVDAGDSWTKTQGVGGYDIRVLVLTSNNAIRNKPKLFINSAIHAREYATAPLSLAFAKWLVEGYGNNADATWIMDNHETHLMLQTNPDGRKRAETGLLWRKNTNQNICSRQANSRGVDLNRNFTDRWNITNGSGSSGNQCSSTYRGPFAGSEPETRAMESYIRSLFPDRRGSSDNDAAPADTSGIHIDIHSFSELVLWPWGDKNSVAPNGTALQTLGRKFAFFNGYDPQQAIGLYPTDGTTDSVSYGELGVPSYTFELGTEFFQDCNVFENDILPGNLPALIYAAKVVRTPYITPSGPDITGLSLSGRAATDGVPAGTVVTLSATATDTRFSSRNGVEPTQNITAVEAYIDTPPWQNGANPISLSANDGQFNEKVEGVSGSIDTSGLSQGRHILYTRSRDSRGIWGAVSAEFLIIDNAATPVVCSLEESFERGSGGWSNSSNSTCSTGSYIAGTPSLQTNGGITTQVGNAFEGDSAYYTASNTSAGNADVDGGNCIASSPVYSVSSPSILTTAYFHGQRDSGDDNNGDFFRLELSTDGGRTYRSIASNGDTASNAEWTEVSASIPAGANVQLRMQCSDGSGGGDLVECGIDNLKICSN